MWTEWFPTQVVIKDAQHIWLLPVGKLFSFSGQTLFCKIPFYTLINSAVVILTRVENGGIVASIVDGAGDKEIEEYIEGEGAETTLQIEMELANTSSVLRYLEIKGIPDSGFTEKIYDLTIFLVRAGGGWRELFPA